MRAFVTVGSTSFDELVEAVFSQSVLQALFKKGFTHLVVQCGKYPLASELRDISVDGPWIWTEEGIQVDSWRYKPSLKDEYDAADLVISHAGTPMNPILFKEQWYTNDRLWDRS